MSRTRHHGNKAKQKTFGEFWRYLQSTPAWWTRLMMTKPQRRAASVWQRKVETSSCLDEADKPPHGNKPHQYFW